MYIWEYDYKDSEIQEIPVDYSLASCYTSTLESLVYTRLNFTISEIFIFPLSDSSEGSQIPKKNLNSKDTFFDFVMWVIFWFMCVGITALSLVGAAIIILRNLK